MGRVQRNGDSGVVALPGARLAATGDISDLDLAHHRERRLEKFDEVPLADLRMVEVESHSQVRVVDGLDQRQGVRGADKWSARMVDRGVEVLQG